MIFGVFAALVGVTVGMLGRTRALLVAVLLEMGLSALCFVLIAGSVSLGVWLLSIGPTVVFVLVYVTMYVREIEAREPGADTGARTGSGAIANSPNMPRRWKI